MNNNRYSITDFAENYIYFYHLEKFCLLPMYPDTVSDSMSSNFKATNSLGRTAPVQTYSNSGPRSVTFSLDLHRDMVNDLNRDVSNLIDKNKALVDFRGEDYVDTLIKYLQAVSLPRYNATTIAKRIIPPMVAVRFGNDIFIRGVVNGNIDVKRDKPIMVDNKYAKLNLSFTVTEVDPYDADEVVKDGSFRGLVATFGNGNIFELSKQNYGGSNWVMSSQENNKKTDTTTTTNINRGNGLIIPPGASNAPGANPKEETRLTGGGASTQYQYYPIGTDLNNVSKHKTVNGGSSTGYQ